MVIDLALYQALTGIGACSLQVSLPTSQALGLTVAPLASVVMSSSSAYPELSRQICTGNLLGAARQYKRLGILPRALLLGYMPSVELYREVYQFKEIFPDCFIALDPVLGDHAKLYRNLGAELIAAIRALSQIADLLTPNLTEALLLAGLPLSSYADYLQLTSAAADAAARKLLAHLCTELRLPQASCVVLKGLPLVEAASASGEQGENACTGYEERGDCEDCEDRQSHMERKGRTERTGRIGCTGYKDCTGGSKCCRGRNYLQCGKQLLHRDFAWQSLVLGASELHDSGLGSSVLGSSVLSSSRLGSAQQQRMDLRQISGTGDFFVSVLLSTYLQLGAWAAALEAASYLTEQAVKVSFAKLAKLASEDGGKQPDFDLLVKQGLSLDLVLPLVTEYAKAHFTEAHLAKESLTQDHLMKTHLMQDNLTQGRLTKEGACTI